MGQVDDLDHQLQMNEADKEEKFAIRNEEPSIKNTSTHG
jgi:hypothetical protein